jgi:hypothetical protein
LWDPSAKIKAEKKGKEERSLLMSTTKLIRLYFRIGLTALIACYCMAMMAYLTIAEGDMTLFSVFSGILGTVIGLWAQEIQARKNNGFQFNESGSLTSGSLTSGTPPPSPIYNGVLHEGGRREGGGQQGYSL